MVRGGRERPLLWGFGTLIAVAALGATRWRLETAWGRSFESKRAVRGFRSADSRLAGTRVIQVLVEGEQREQHQGPVLRRMDALSTFIAHQPLPVGKVSSLVDLLQQMSRVMDKAGNGALPDSQEGIAQYLLLYSMGGDEEDLSRLVDPDFRRATITAYLRTDDFRAMKAMTVAAQAEADRLFAGLPVQARVGGGRGQRDRFNETMVRGKP